MALRPIELTPKDLSSWRTGNRGVDYVHAFYAGRPGPHVIVNALTHGNEFCGMIAVTHLLEQGIRPLRGKLTLSFANVEPYQRVDAATPFDSRFVERDFHRLREAGYMEGPNQAATARLARTLTKWTREASV